MNSINKDYHLWVMSQCPGMVAEFLQCEEGTEYDNIQLLAAQRLNEGSAPMIHG